MTNITSKRGPQLIADVVEDGQTVRTYGPGSLTFIVARTGNTATITHERLGGVQVVSDVTDATMIANRVEVLA